MHEGRRIGREPKLPRVGRADGRALRARRGEDEPIARVDDPDLLDAQRRPEPRARSGGRGARLRGLDHQQRRIGIGGRSAIEVGARVGCGDGAIDGGIVGADTVDRRAIGGLGPLDRAGHIAEGARDAIFEASTLLGDERAAHRDGDGERRQEAGGGDRDAEADAELHGGRRSG